MHPRSDNRKAAELRPVEFLRAYTRYAEGSVLVTMGNTEVLCNVSVSRGVPKFLQGKKQGWLSAEYSMLPRATHDRSQRDSSRGKANARALEIQRLIGRSLRAMVNLAKLPEISFTVDCDVIQADGGTRTASINGAAIALLDAIDYCLAKKLIKVSPVVRRVAAVSVGLVNDKPLLDLDYQEDSQAQTDMNIVLDDSLNFIELQGTAERDNFTMQQLLQMLSFGKDGCQQLLSLQQQARATEPG